MYKVGAGGYVHKVLAPIHHVLAVYFGYDLTPFLYLRNYGTRLGEALAGLITEGVLEGIAMLCPVNKVPTGSN
jgi:hypothetical protein